MQAIIHNRLLVGSIIILLILIILSYAFWTLFPRIAPNVVASPDSSFPIDMQLRAMPYSHHKTFFGPAFTEYLIPEIDSSDTLVRRWILRNIALNKEFYIEQSFQRTVLGNKLHKSLSSHVDDGDEECRQAARKLLSEIYQK